MTTDLTFITNEENNKLVDRFAALIKDSQYFDCLVGYFYTSGFHSIYRSLENTEKIRILIGIRSSETFFDGSGNKRRLVRGAQYGQVSWNDF